MNDGPLSLSETRELLARLAHMPKPLIFAGGNCSIFGFDQEGTEAFWTG